MITQFIEKLLLDNFKLSPTSGQLELIKLLSEFVFDLKKRDIFVLKGYAGTGKTSIVSALVKALTTYKLKTVLLAPTGRAAKVLAGYAQHDAFTIHKKIYRQKSSVDAFGEFEIDRNLHSNTIFIVDEASMISNNSNELSVFGTGKLLNDLIEFVYSGNSCKLILLGDTAQLPPIGIEISPALDTNYIEMYDIPVIEYELTEVVRQGKNSGILENATRLREVIPQFTNFQFIPRFRTKNFNDVVSLDNSELFEEISSSYCNKSIEETIIVCRSNKRANKYNEAIRNKILGKDTKISVGDYLMIVKNNYFWAKENIEIPFIANGDVVKILKIEKYESIYGFNFADVKLQFLDYKNSEFSAKIILETLNIDAPSLTSEENRNLFFAVAEDFNNEKSKKNRYKKVKENQYFNALQVKFSYAITCHKAQGGQWKNVFIDQDYFNDDMINVEYIRWLYTAVTRCTEKLFLVNFKENFFE